MSAERFFDDLARTLAEPMPRRRAVRVIGVSLAAIAVPGVSPRVARGAAPTPQACPPGQSIFCDTRDANGQFVKRECCPYPEQRYDCGGPRGDTCVDTCPPVNPVSKKKQTATWSSARWGPNGKGPPKKYNCCPVPDTIPSNGECLPNCKRVLGPKAIQCGKFCCPPGHRCKGNGQCIPCPRGHEGCGSTCCKSGKECTTCYEAGNDYSTGHRNVDTGREKCCAPGERCCRDMCCPSSTACCGGFCCSKSLSYCARGTLTVGCCPKSDTLVIDNHAYCCPKGTVPVGNSTKPLGRGCCPPGDPNCCPPSDGLGNVLSCASRGQICVRGECVDR